MSDDDLIEKLRDHADRMSRRGDHRGAYYYEAGANEIERLNGVVKKLVAALQRIDGINDNPAIYNPDIDAVVRAAIAKATGGE